MSNKTRSLLGMELRPVPGHEGKYSVTKDGQVFSHWSGGVMAPYPNWHGYSQIILRKDGKNHINYVHRLVALAYLPQPDNKNEVNHIDGNKTNNSVENLEWVDRSENITKAYANGLISRKFTRSKRGESKETRVYKPGDPTKYFVSRKAGKVELANG